MNDSEKLREERTRNRHDVYDNKIPERVPIQASLGIPILAEYGKIDRKSAYWDPSLLRAAAEELCELIPSDTCLYGGTVYTPVSSQTLDSVNKVMSDKGYMQHPNTECMNEDEYDELIADPYAFIADKCIPRVYKNLNTELNPGRFIFALLQEAAMKQKLAQKEMQMISELYQKFGYPSGDYGSYSRAPMDWIADQLRSFSGICIDIRRQRSKVAEALDAVTPMLYKVGLAGDFESSGRYASVGFQLHMATYLREKDFAEIFLPSWKRMADDYASAGIRSNSFLEHDWTRLLDYVYDFPVGSHFSFEFTDAAKIKEKLGKKHILSGGFPLQNLTVCTKQEVISRTKEWLDIMAPGGQYIFGFDKGAMAMSDINIENLAAVCETVRDYGVYDNPGAPAGEIFDKSDYIRSGMPEFKSRYFVEWEDYIKKYPNTPDNAQPLVMYGENEMFSLLFGMSC